MKHLLKPVAAAVLRVFAALTAPLFAHVARTGYGSNACVKRGFVPVPLHFYQPVFDPDTLPAAVWERRHDLPGVAFDPDGQVRFLEALGAYGHECAWPERLAPGERLRYHSDNPSFAYASGALLHAVVRHFKPGRVVEIGSGMSSLVFDEALERNERLDGRRGELVTIDPFPHPAHQVLDGDRTRIVARGVEDVPLEEFTSLGHGDLLFIDSSHAVRTGGDVTYLYLDVLPRLGPGVVVHIHDVQLPYDYPRTYAQRESPPRVYWNEQYLLHAFLVHNPRVVLLAGGYFLQTDHPAEFARAFPEYRPERHRATTSIYLQTR